MRNIYDNDNSPQYPANDNFPLLSIRGFVTVVFLVFVFIMALRGISEWTTMN
jgi:hypothetical protein